MKRCNGIAVLFLVSAVYDALLGLVFLAVPGRLFAFAGVTPPNHPGYVRFPALLLLVFAWMFLRIAAAPSANRNLMPYGIGLKCAYSGTVFGYWFTSGLPAIWKPFAVYDVFFAAAFAAAYLRLGRVPPKPVAA